MLHCLVVDVAALHFVGPSTLVLSLTSNNFWLNFIFLLFWIFRFQQFPCIHPSPDILPTVSVEIWRTLLLGILHFNTWNATKVARYMYCYKWFFLYKQSIYPPPNTVYHHIPYNLLNSRTKIEMKIASFLSMSFSFYTTINQRTKIDTKIVFFSINILFPSTKLSLTKPDPKPTLKEFFLSDLIWNSPQEIYSPTPKPYLQAIFLSQTINNVSTQPFNACEPKHKNTLKI